MVFLALLKSPGIAVAVALVVALGGFGGCQWHRALGLEDDLASLRKDKALCDASLALAESSVEDLSEAIDQQNQALAQLKKDSSDLRATAALAQGRADAHRRLRAIEVAEMLERPGETCADGIALIDEELGL